MVYSSWEERQWFIHRGRRICTWKSWLSRQSSWTKGEECIVEERKLLFISYKNVIGVYRASGRSRRRRAGAMMSMGSQWYRAKMKAELPKISEGILCLLHSHLIPSSTAPESKVFYLKMNHGLGKAPRGRRPPRTLSLLTSLRSRAGSNAPIRIVLS